ncbi:MAG: cytochrome c3 family protein [Gammaproteobacteria bacterium]|nr:cytochrome c3 family protein [Gammaproteobacteria bacterium]
MKRYFFLLIFLTILPAKVYAGLFAEKIMQLESDLDQPSDIAVHDDGRAYVLDGVNNRVVVYHPNGKKDFIFYGDKKGLNQPMGISIADEQVYIADSGFHRIAIFTLQGEFLKSLLLVDELPPEPVALVVTEGMITWSDRRNHKICRTAVDTGKTLLCWGKRGESRGDFQFPFQLKFDRDDYLHVVDVLNGRVQVFNHQGRYFNQVGRFGLEGGELYRPNGLALYNDQYLLVSDAYRGTVSVFKNKRSVGLLVDTEQKPLQFSAPTGLTVWQDHLYVVDALNNRVDVFRLHEYEGGSLTKDTRADLSQKNCAICHLAWAPDYSTDEGEQDDVPPVATERMCYSCHHGAVLDSRKAIGRGEQHPDIHHQREEAQNKKISPAQNDKIPKVFPLLKSASTMRGKKRQLSCGSCHTPHTKDIDKADTLYTQHKNPWLRVLNNDGDLCQQCHESKLDDVRNTKVPLSGINHPVGIYLKVPPGDEKKYYATSEKLHNGLPESLLSGGVTLGRDKQMICQSCHQIHGATNEALTPLNFDEGQLCAECHDRQHAKDKKDAKIKGIHPVNIELEKSLKINGNEIKKITCLTCHSIHNGEKGTAILTINDQDGKLCSNCHKKYDAVVNSDHDLRVTAEKYQNRLGHTPEQSGACGICHTMHRGNPETPFLYAGEFQPYKGKEPALERDRICLDCHRKKGSAEKMIVTHFSHPAKDLILQSDPKVLPLINAKNEIDEFGVIACITCHEPHRWEPEQNENTQETLEPEKILPKNKKGTVLNSFLRRKGIKGTFCINCHGLETRVKYKYYHDKLSRDKNIDYIK